jgi:dihydroneopterin aldolase
MSSIAAKEVAKEVLENLGKGKRPNLGKIARKKGYKDNTADNPKNITETQSYKDVINPVVKALEIERRAVIERLKKTRSKAKYRDLIDGLDKITKNIQLLNGGKTSNDGIQISWE